jgi:hypothetical protein
MVREFELRSKLKENRTLWIQKKKEDKFVVRYKALVMTRYLHNIFKK